ncbi:hypothetical protein PoB_002435200 [Plakobranchus ocellatus]|uniref:Uncharacterized protein n=1 Tax=Plakobranchus ocellatus TaxID=259542 RepID=A0AAV3ZRS8_9GAST|nr:hypothetical protein PoB_002435200 [Plakobranchus ocellatus]
MATSAIVYSPVKATASWTVNDLNQILIFGDYLYKEIDEQLPENEHGYLLISEIPHKISLFGTTVYLQRSRSLCGIIASVQLSQAATSINEAISQVFERHPSAIVILKDTSMMIHKDPESRIWLFDSHSRNGDGMLAPDEVGKIILINLKDMADLNLYMAQLAGALSDHFVTFEVVGFTATQLLQACDSDTSNRGAEEIITEPAVTEAAEPAVTEAAEPAVTEAAEPAVTEAAEPAVTEAAEPSFVVPCDVVTPCSMLTDAMPSDSGPGGDRPNLADGFLEHLLTDDETWVHHMTPETKQELIT